MTLLLPSTFVEIDREKFKLRLYKRPVNGREFILAKHFDIAIGAMGYGTPRGIYLVLAKSRAKFPDWQMPYSDWVAPELRGKVIPGGAPENPIKERWIRLTDDGVGIHGTGDIASIGSRASHGCIRMKPEDVIDLYPEVRTGTHVYII